MLEQKQLSISFGIVVLFGFVFFLAFILHTPSIKKVSSPIEESVELPLYIRIPEINIDTSIEYVGSTALGAVDVPKGPKNGAWFNLSPRPGEIGSAIIDGHSGWKDNTEAVFDNLYKLKKGDKIYIEDDKGVTTTFVVRELKSYGQNENVSNVFGVNDRGAHLNLITCAGDWNERAKSHSKRLVVFTDKEE